MPPMTRSRTIIDLDAQLPPVPENTAETVEVKLFDQTWHLSTDVNNFTALGVAAGDAASVRAFMVKLVVEEEQLAFIAALDAQKGMTVERVLAIMNLMIEAAAERPTKLPERSSRTAAPRPSSRNSVARTGSRTAAR